MFDLIASDKIIVLIRFMTELQASEVCQLLNVKLNTVVVGKKSTNTQQPKIDIPVLAYF